jgi:hypothetical protein
MLFLGAAALAMGCAGGMKPPAETPPRPVDPQTQVTPRHEQQPPRLIAPPPAYGNKIVMAGGSGPASFN